MLFLKSLKVRSAGSQKERWVQSKTDWRQTGTCVCLQLLQISLLWRCTCAWLKTQESRRRKSMGAEGVWILPRPHSRGWPIGQQKRAGPTVVPGALNQHSKHNDNLFLPPSKHCASYLVLYTLIQNYIRKGNVLVGKLKERCIIIIPILDHQPPAKWTTNSRSIECS